MRLRVAGARYLYIGELGVAKRNPRARLFLVAYLAKSS